MTPKKLLTQLLSKSQNPQKTKVRKQLDRKNLTCPMSNGDLAREIEMASTHDIHTFFTQKI